MEATVLIRTLSGSGSTSSPVTGELDSFATGSMFSSAKCFSSSLLRSPPRSVHFDRRSDTSSPLRRSRSDAGTVRSLVRSESRHSDRQTRTAGEKESPVDSALRRSDSVLSIGISDQVAFPAKTSVVEEEVEFSGGDAGNGRRVGWRGRGEGGEGHGDGEQSGVGDYYKEMLRSDPENPLLLRNYGKFLHEVKGDVAGAEECYGRAILASPGDGEVLSLYGKLVWETHRDEERADVYYQRAVEASPDDCHVLGSYAHFLWDTEEEESSTAASNDVMIEAF